MTTFRDWIWCADGVLLIQTRIVVFMSPGLEKLWTNAVTLLLSFCAILGATKVNWSDAETETFGNWQEKLILEFCDCASTGLGCLCSSLLHSAVFTFGKETGSLWFERSKRRFVSQAAWKFVILRCCHPLVAVNDQEGSQFTLRPDGNMCSQCRFLSQTHFGNRHLVTFLLSAVISIVRNLLPQIWHYVFDSTSHFSWLKPTWLFRFIYRTNVFLWIRRKLCKRCWIFVEINFAQRCLVRFCAKWNTVCPLSQTANSQDLLWA